MLSIASLLSVMAVHYVVANSGVLNMRMGHSIKLRPLEGFNQSHFQKAQAKAWHSMQQLKKQECVLFFA